MDQARVRGQHRKLRCLIRHIEEFNAFEHLGLGYEHFHVPSGQFIESPKTSGRIKTEFARAWIQKAEEMLSQKPNDLPFCKIVAMIDEPYFWNSQIIIFYDEEYYRSFWHRSGPVQTWEVSKQMSFTRRRNIATILPEISMKETIHDDDFSRKSVLWFYGEFPEELR